MYRASKEYKRTMHFYINKYKHCQSQKLRQLSDKNPKQYWKFLNKLMPKHKKNESPSSEDFFPPP